MSISTIRMYTVLLPIILLLLHTLPSVSKLAVITQKDSVSQNVPISPIAGNPIVGTEQLMIEVHVEVDGEVEEIEIGDNDVSNINDNINSNIKKNMNDVSDNTDNDNHYNSNEANNYDNYSNNDSNDNSNTNDYNNVINKTIVFISQDTNHNSTHINTIITIPSIDKTHQIVVYNHGDVIGEYKLDSIIEYLGVNNEYRGILYALYMCVYVYMCLYV